MDWFEKRFELILPNDCEELGRFGNPLSILSTGRECTEKCLFKGMADTGDCWFIEFGSIFKPGGWLLVVVIGYYYINFKIYQCF